MQRLRSGRRTAQLQALKAPRELAVRAVATGESAERHASADAGAIPVLVELLSCGSVALQCAAASLLKSVIRGWRQLAAAFASVGGVQATVKLLMAGGTAEAQGAAAMPAGACGDDTSRALVEAGAVPLLARLWASSHYDAQAGTAAALSNIAGCSPDAKAQVIGAGVLPSAMSLLTTGDTTLQAGATTMLSALARGLTEDGLAAIAAAGAIPGLVRCLGVREAHIQQTAAKALAALCRGCPGRCLEAQRAGALEVLINCAILQRSMQPRAPARAPGGLPAHAGRPGSSAAAAAAQLASPRT